MELIRTYCRHAVKPPPLEHMFVVACHGSPDPGSPEPGSLGADAAAARLRSIESYYVRIFLAALAHARPSDASGASAWPPPGRHPCGSADERLFEKLAS